MRAGIREVRDRFSHFLARVRRGEDVIITDRGRDVAVIRRLRPKDSLGEWVARLEADGLVEPAERWGPIGRERPHRLEGMTLSEIIREERRSGW
jgi:prevent-host-death family protein